MSLLEHLTEAVLHEAFDPATITRAKQYVRMNRVMGAPVVEYGDGTLTAAAHVRGTRTIPYQVSIDIEGNEDDPEDGSMWVMSTCTCPVHHECKHGAALAIVLMQEAADHQAASEVWESELMTLMGQLAEQRQPEPTLPGLAIEISARSDHYSGNTTFTLRTLRQGARSGWAKSGADWESLARARAGKDFPHDQLVALQQLVTAGQRNNRYYYSFNGSPTLSDFGMDALPLLRQAVDAGVTLLPGTGITAVELLAEAVTLSGQAQRADDNTTIRVGLSFGERFLSGDTLHLVGSPAHSVALLEDGVLTLAGLSTPLPGTAQRLVSARTPLTVPAKGQDKLSDILGPLARLVPLTSPDDSVEIPEPPHPHLVLAVSWHSVTHASLSWSFAYRERRYPLGSGEDLGVVRDVDAELDVAGRIPSKLRGRSEVRDGDALTLAIHDLPALREIDDVEVVEVERPDFRESSDAPEISFELAEPDPEADETSTDWLDLQVVISVAGEQVPLPDVLTALTHEDDYLVLPSGLYLSTDRAEFDKLRNVVEAASQIQERSGDRIGVGKTDLGVWAELAELGVVTERAAEWVRRAQALRDLVEIPRPEPTGLATELRHYQADGLAWLAFLHDHGLGGVLADDMGLGKTLQVLATIVHARSTKPDDGPFLVVAPTSVVPGWVAEAARHTPGLRVATVNRRSDSVDDAREGSDIVVTTYALLRLEADTFAAHRWSGFILDEAQQVKNHQSKTYAAARRIDAGFRLAVTGTPFENRLMELWALLSITAPGLYPSPRSFRDNVVTPVEKRGEARALERFQTRLRPFLLRRTKELVADDLPPKQEQVLGIDLAPKHRKIYDTHLARERQKVLNLLDDYDGNRVAILAALTRLRQLALDPGLIDSHHNAVGSAKLDTLVEHLEEITQEGHKALVFSQFTGFLGRARERLAAAGIRTSYLDGSTRDRGAVIESFREGDAPVFLISLKAGGTGLTLTEADYVFVLDPWWNPAAEAQAVDRAHRIGQTQHVMVYRLVSTDTIEEKVMELKERKAELFAKVVDGEGAMSTSISAEDIRDLFK